MTSPLDALGAEVRAEGGLLAAALRAGGPDPAQPPLPAGPRAAEVGLLLEAIREGELLHYGTSRLLDTAADPDLGLLAGDRLYALGLQRLAELGDLDAVCVLADVISQVARAAAEERPELADQAWSEGLREVHRAHTEEPGAPGGAAGAPQA